MSKNCIYILVRISYLVRRVVSTRFVHCSEVEEFLQEWGFCSTIYKQWLECNRTQVNAVTDLQLIARGASPTL